MRTKDYDEGFDKGVAVERDRIVAWLRSDVLVQVWPHDFVAAGIPKRIADAIERGEHEEQTLYTSTSDVEEKIPSEPAESNRENTLFAERFPEQVGHIGTHYPECYRSHPACAWRVGWSDGYECAMKRLAGGGRQ